jgi:hypothetical protein
MVCRHWVRRFLGCVDDCQRLDSSLGIEPWVTFLLPMPTVFFPTCFFSSLPSDMYYRVSKVCTVSVRLISYSQDVY